MTREELALELKTNVSNVLEQIKNLLTRKDKIYFAESAKRLQDVFNLLVTGDDDKAVESASRFALYVESQGGVIREKRVGPKGDEDTIVYSGDGAAKNHTYALRLIETLEEIFKEDPDREIEKYLDLTGNPIEIS